ncbi:DDE endonuclease [Streptomyces sp. A5-4]
MRPPRARTWGRVGQTPEVRVRGRGSGRVSMAGMTCYRQGKRSRMFYSFHVYRGRKNEKKGFAWEDFRDLIVRAHIQLGGPIVLVWDNLRAHLMPQMRAFPQEGVWSLVKRTIGNLAAANLDQLARAVKRSLKQIQYRPHLVDGCLAGTGLIMEN